MAINRDNPVFLATTALEAFWDTSKPIVFLGPWCLLHERRAAWEALGGDSLPDPFGAPGAAAHAYELVQQAYERALPVLAQALNRVHGTAHDVRYWRVVVGWWLLTYVSVLYERYSSVKAALARHPDLATWVLDEACWVVPATTHEFASYLLEDSYNLQLYSRLFGALGKQFPARGAVRQEARYVKAGKPSWKQAAVRRASRLYGHIASSVTRTVVLKDSYFPKAAIGALAARRPGRIVPSWGSSRQFADWPLQPALRAPLHDLALGDSEFERCVAALLPFDLPRCFVEGHGDIGAAARSDFPQRPGAVFSANAWYYDEVFKQWAAGAAERGAPLLGCQHGGNYGAVAMMASEDHETAIVDRYFTWGWERPGRPAQVVPMPAPKLIGAARGARGAGKCGLLWVATMMPRYLVHFPTTPAEFARYLAWQQRFAAALDAGAFAQLRLRPHREDNGWDLAGRLRAAFPGLAIETWDVPFRDSMDNCALYICDHLSTTFIEALAAGTPSILFWEPGANELRTEAQDAYPLLRAAGILHDSPEAAAAAVNRIQDDVDHWWREPARQQAVAAFCERFARTDADPIGAWEAQLLDSLGAARGRGAA